ncbi:MAG: tripartite tricarboxylate transporter substrate binding protein [Variovorax sp.]|nr:MAG: tripartite tricarboxylate transporter substrate binding protein [Variovorax sp.]
MTINRRNLMLAAVSATASTHFAAWGQAYPSKAIRLVVPYPAGSTLDVVARMFTEVFSRHFGQPSIVVNQPGGSAAIGTRAVAQAEADGYTLLLGTNQTHGANSALMPNLGYDAIKDFEPIAGIGRIQHVVVVRKDLGVKTLAEFMALARKPGQKINYGSSGNGSASHLAAEMFKLATGVQMTHIPFNGSGPAAQALMGGHIDVSFITLPSVLSFIKAGGMTALAVASPDRAPQLPALATLAEQGVPNAEADAWAALFAPARTPPGALTTLSDFTVQAFSTPEMKEKLNTSGFVPDTKSGSVFREYLQEDMKRWADVVKAAKVKLD